MKRRNDKYIDENAERWQRICEIFMGLLLAAIILVPSCTRADDDVPPWFSCDADSVYIWVPTFFETGGRNMTVRDIAETDLGDHYAEKIKHNFSKYTPIFMGVAVNPDIDPVLISPDSIAVVLSGGQEIKADGWMEQGGSYTYVHPGDAKMLMLFFPWFRVDDKVKGFVVNLNGRKRRLQFKNKVR